MNDDGYNWNIFFYGCLILFLLYVRDCTIDRAPEFCDRVCEIKGHPLKSVETDGLFMPVKCYCGREHRQIPLEQR